MERGVLNEVMNDHKEPSKKNEMISSKSWRMLSMVFALVAIWVIFYFATGGVFLEARNLSNLFRQMSVTGTLAMGMVLIIVAGHIDLSVGSVVCFLGVILAMLLGEGYSGVTAISLTLCVGFAISAFQGWLTSYQRVPAFIATLGGMMAFRGASLGVTEGNTIPLADGWIKSFGSSYISGSSGWILGSFVVLVAGFLLWKRINNQRELGFEINSIKGIWLPLLVFGALVIGFVRCMNSYEGIPYPVLVMLGLLVVFHFLATRTVFGRHVYAVGGSLEAAYLSGVQVRKVVFGNFLLMGFLTTVAAVILTARVESAQPDAGQLLELDAIASCVIGGTSLMGGKGTIYGALLGALIMESLNNGMSLANMESFWQYIVKGAVLVVAVWADVASQKAAK